MLEQGSHSHSGSHHNQSFAVIMPSKKGFVVFFFHFFTLVVMLTTKTCLCMKKVNISGSEFDLNIVILGVCQYVRHTYGLSVF